MAGRTGAARAVGLGLMLAAAACGRGDGRGDGGRKVRVPVTAVEAAAPTRGVVRSEIVVSANVEAAASADLTAPAAGMVVRVLADVGDTVGRGAVLAQLDRRVASAGLASGGLRVQQLARQLAEELSLLAAGASTETAVRELRNQLETARASLREAEVNASMLKIVAPFTGVIAARDLQVGEAAGGGARAFQLVDTRHLRVVARLPERDLARIASGQSARLSPAYEPERVVEARVSEVAPVVDAATGTFQVRIDLPPDGGGLKHGQYVHVRLELERHEDARLVPRDAVLTDNGKPVVFVVQPAPDEAPEASDEDEREPSAGWWPWDAGEGPGDATTEDEEQGPAFIARRVPVELGLRDASFAEILAGIEDDATVVTVGQGTLKDGARVRVLDAAPAVPTPEGTPP